MANHVNQIFVNGTRAALRSYPFTDEEAHALNISGVPVNLDAAGRALIDSDRIPTNSEAKIATVIANDANNTAKLEPDSAVVNDYMDTEHRNVNLPMVIKKPTASNRLPPEVGPKYFAHNIPLGFNPEYLPYDPSVTGAQRTVSIRLTQYAAYLKRNGFDSLLTEDITTYQNKRELLGIAYVLLNIDDEHFYALKDDNTLVYATMVPGESPTIQPLTFDGGIDTTQLCYEQWQYTNGIAVIIARITSSSQITVLYATRTDPTHFATKTIDKTNSVIVHDGILYDFKINSTDYRLTCFDLTSGATATTNVVTASKRAIKDHRVTLTASGVVMMLNLTNSEDLFCINLQVITVTKEGDALDIHIVSCYTDRLATNAITYMSLANVKLIDFMFNRIMLFIGRVPHATSAIRMSVLQIDCITGNITDQYREVIISPSSVNNIEGITCVYELKDAVAVPLASDGTTVTMFVAARCLYLQDDRYNKTATLCAKVELHTNDLLSSRPESYGVADSGYIAGTDMSPINLFNCATSIRIGSRIHCFSAYAYDPTKVRLSVRYFPADSSLTAEELYAYYLGKGNASNDEYFKDVNVPVPMQAHIAVRQKAQQCYLQEMCRNLIGITHLGSADATIAYDSTSSVLGVLTGLGSQNSALFKLPNDNNKDVNILPPGEKGAASMLLVHKAEDAHPQILGYPVFD